MPPKTVGSSKVETEPRPKIDFLKTSLPKIKSPRTLVLIHNLKGMVMQCPPTKFHDEPQREGDVLNRTRAEATLIQTVTNRPTLSCGRLCAKWFP